MAKRARQARTWGILALCMPVAMFLPLIGLVALPGAIAFGITAIVMGSRLKRELAPFGQTAEMGAARTAVVLGIIALCLVPVLVIVAAAVVFVLVTKLSGNTAAIILVA